MENSPEKRISFAGLLGMNSYSLGLSFMWNSLHPIVLPAVLLHLVPAGAKNSYLGGLTFLGMLLAMFRTAHFRRGQRSLALALGQAPPISPAGNHAGFCLSWAVGLVKEHLGVIAGLRWAANYFQRRSGTAAGIGPRPCAARTTGACQRREESDGYGRCDHCLGGGRAPVIPAGPLPDGYYAGGDGRFSGQHSRYLFVRSRRIQFGRREKETLSIQRGVPAGFSQQSQLCLAARLTFCVPDGCVWCAGFCAVLHPGCYAGGESGQGYRRLNDGPWR